MIPMISLAESQHCINISPIALSAEAEGLLSSANMAMTDETKLSNSNSYVNAIMGATSSNIYIKGTVFDDSNGNAIFDKDEQGLAERTIFLMKNGTEISNTTTDSYGRYSFENLTSGYYGLVERLKDGWSMTSPIGGFHSVTISESSVESIDFGNIQSQNLQLSNRSSERQSLNNGTYIFGSNISSNKSAAFNHTLMKPTIDEFIKMLGEYASLPRVTVSPEVMAKALQTSQVSLLDYLQYTPSERWQGKCGNCWVWSGTGVAEIALNVQNNIKDRLSIQYYNSNYNRGTGTGFACCGGKLGGGWLTQFADFYDANGKMIPWSNKNAEWQDEFISCGGTTSCPANTIIDNPYYAVTFMQASSISTHSAEGVSSNAQAIANIKSVLNNGKAVCFSVFFPTPQDEENMAFYTKPETFVWDPSTSNGKTGSYGAHAMLVVGYDESDPSNRYWIVLNSWGAPSNRPHGLIRMKMDMDYNCYHYDSGSWYSFYWLTLNADFITRPTVTNDGSPSGIGNTVATVGARITNTGNENPHLYIGWGTSDYGTGSWPNNIDLGIQGTGTYYADLSDLTPGTTYYYRCYAANSIGTGWASTSARFTTTSPVPSKPTVTNGAGVTLITSNSARLNGEITNTGGENPEVRVCLGTWDGGTNLLNWEFNAKLGKRGKGPFYYDIDPTGLQPETHYYYRCYASNSAGISWSSTVQFDTLSAISKPTVTNGVGWELVTANSARLNGEIANTGGESPAVHICWGTTDGITTQANWQNDQPVGILGTGTFYKDISGLTPGTQYYYRCYAANSAGTSWSGQTVTFITSNQISKPAVTNGVGASSVASNSARLTGEITNTGNENPRVTIYYGLNDGVTNVGSWSSHSDLGIRSVGTFYADIGSLSPGTDYYYRCYASNSAGPSWASSTATFTTNSVASNLVAIQTANGQYLCAEGSGGEAVVANRNAIAGWETFKLIDRGNGNVALQAANGQYLCAEGGGGGAVVANRNSIAAWETFKLIDRGNGYYALQAYNGQYLCAEGGGGEQIVANRNAIAAWETFRILDMRRPAKVALQAYNGQYVCAEGGGGQQVVANRNAASGWETFKLIDRGNGNVALQAYNGQYLCAEGGGGQQVVANRNAIDAWETFRLIYRGDGNVALQAFRGQYVCAEGGGGDGVVANRDWIAGWETFRLIPD